MSDTPRPKSSYDVIVIGGGPAGAAAATFLQRLGHETLVLERSVFPRYHIGESLIPHTYGTLDRLGLLPQLKASNFPEKHSVRFVSPSGEHSDPFYFSETISGDGSRTWQVERSVFDQMCLDNARSTGVEVCASTQVDKVLFDRDRAVGVQTSENGKEPTQIKSRVVIDASGRRSLIGNQLGLRGPVPGLEKSSIWSYYKGGRREAGLDAGETTIFVLRDGGWFWYIPLPDDMISVGLVAAHDDLFPEREEIEATLDKKIQQCKPLAERLVKATRTEPVRGIRQLAYRNARFAGDGWVMIGDAAAFLDPIYSSGLFLALGSAELAANAVHDALSAGDVSEAKLGTFTAPLISGVEVIRRLIYAFYDPTFSFRKFVERFPDQRNALIDCLVGDVIGKDMSPFLDSLAQMTPPPAPL